MRLTSGLLRNLVGTSWSIEVTPTAVIYERGSSPPVSLNYSDIRQISVEDGLLSYGINIRLTGSSIEFTGMSSRNAHSFVNETVGYMGPAIASAIQKHEAKIRSAEHKFASFSEGTFYLNQTKVCELKALLPDELSLFEHPYLNTELLTPEIRHFARTYKEFINPASKYTQKRNQIYVTRQREKYRELFSNLEKYPLTDEQQEAVVTEEDNTLLIAAAGSGKSSTITAKIAYLLSEAQLEPNQLGIFAFNRSTQAELSKRVLNACEKLGIDGEKITVSTFHSFSLEVIRTVQGEKPTISEMVTGANFNRALMSIIQDLCAENRSFQEAFLLYNSIFKNPAPDEDTIKTKQDYDLYLMDLDGTRDRDHETGAWHVTLESMDGTVVKSLEELRIANWLFINGIDYKYEQPYVSKTATAERRQYRPDFYYPQANLWHEHYALNKYGKAPSFMQGYEAGVSWKRELHQQNNTQCIETRSAMFADGTIFESLRAQLESYGITPRPRSQDDINRLIEEAFNPDKDIEFIAKFLTHFKANNLTIDALHERAKEHRDKSRSNALLSIFVPIYNAYENRLSQEGAIDFQDCLNQAAQMIESKQFGSPLKYILVDEFQDSSQSFLRLIKALKAQTSDIKFFAVGDDWQSINGFAGADIEVMRSFPNLFGYTKQLFLTNTFRSYQEIADVASKFIQENPEQFRKTVQTQKQANCPAIFLTPSSSRYPSEALYDCLQRIQQQAENYNRKFTVFLLARYNRQKRALDTLLRDKFPSLEIEARTIHTSKGLEADYVLIAGVDAGNYGFPSEISDDPLLSLVLPKKEEFLHAEERRLMYVAITRAKTSAFIFYDPNRPSSFVKELASYEEVVCEDPALTPKPSEGEKCPDCGFGRLEARKGSSGPFLGCLRYPSCRYTAQLYCNTCDSGVIAEKRNRNGETFYACNNFPRCTFIHKALSKRHRKRRR